MKMNETISKFLINKNIDMDKIEKLEEKIVKSSFDINWIVKNYNIPKNNYISKQVCIDDIEGYNYNFMDLDNKNVINNMPYFFDEHKIGYASRSLSLLEISTQDIIKNLEKSFKNDPICLNEADEGKYVIGSNGLHRYHVIKAHFLKELSQIDKRDINALKELKSQYTFETLITETDFLKTYSSFLLQKIAQCQDKNIVIMADYDMQVGLTGKVVLRNDDDGVECVLDDKKLILILKDYIENLLSDRTISKKKFKDFFDIIKISQEKFASFNKFCEQNLKEFMPYLNLKNYKNFSKENYNENL